jgi:hypothetical protein
MAAGARSMIPADILRAVSEIGHACTCVETIDDVRVLCDVAAAIGRELDASDVERSLKRSIERLERVRR